jgi:hypothetical protein
MLTSHSQGNSGTLYQLLSRFRSFFSKGFGCSLQNSTQTFTKNLVQSQEHVKCIVDEEHGVGFILKLKKIHFCDDEI